MRYAGIIKNDVVNSCYDIAVSVWCQGCPFKCNGCHNPDTWDFEGGVEEDKYKLINEIIKYLKENNVQRNLSVLGGEPLCDENVHFTHDLIRSVKQVYPDIKCFIWTGYVYEDILNDSEIAKTILPYIDILIDGKFEESKRDVSLPFRGSTNQRVIDVQKSLKEQRVVLYNTEA